MWNLKYDTNGPIYETETLIDIEKRLVVAKGEGDRGRVDGEFGVRRCKLVHRGGISNKVLLSGTGTSIPYPVINHHGKEAEKDWMRVYICVTRSLCCTAEANTAWSINYSPMKLNKHTTRQNDPVCSRMNSQRRQVNQQVEG